MNTFRLLITEGIGYDVGHSIFVILAMAMCMLLYTLLGALHQSFDPSRLSLPESRLLIVLAKHGALPLSYWQPLSKNPAVAVAAPVSNNTFYYQNPSNGIEVGIVDPQSYLRLFPGLQVNNAEKRAWVADQAGALISRDLAQRYHWHLGSTIPLMPSGLSLPKPLYVTVDGIVPRESYGAMFSGRLLIHLDYFQHWLPMNIGNFLVFALSTKPGVNQAQLSQSIDRQFKNSPDPTETHPFNVFIQQWVNRIGNIGGYSIIVMTICIVGIFLAVVSAGAQGFRKRRNDYRLMLALGFTKAKLTNFLFLEHAILILPGAAVGIALGVLSARAIHPAMLPYFYVGRTSVVTGAMISCGILVVTVFVQVLTLLRVRTAEIASEI